MEKLKVGLAIIATLIVLPPTVVLLGLWMGYGLSFLLPPIH